VDLLLALRTPHLPGAACRGRWELFDDRGRQAEAIQLCQSCPALALCRQWVDSLKPSQRPPGVIAGRAPTERNFSTSRSFEERQHETPSERWLRLSRATRKAPASR
jgi:hypothetical protein